MHQIVFNFFFWSVVAIVALELIVCAIKCATIVLKHWWLPTHENSVEKPWIKVDWKREGF